jgi:hypothetical protein
LGGMEWIDLAQNRDQWRAHYCLFCIHLLITCRLVPISGVTHYLCSCFIPGNTVIPNGGSEGPREE